MLALAPMDTTEITALTTIARASAFDVMTRDRVAFRVEKRPLYTGDGRVVPDHFATVRTDCDRVLGVVGNRYRVFQGETALSLLDACSARGLIEYGRAGTFKGGAIVWLQAKLPGSLIVGPDEVAKYLLLATTHDGSGTTRIVITPTRVVCRNTLMMARDTEGGMTIRHTQSADGKIKAAQIAIENANRSFERFGEVADRLYRKQMSYSATKAAIEAVFPQAGDEVSTRLDNTRRRVIDLVESGKGQWAVRGTAWGTYNAITEYVDHHRATRGDEANRLESSWLGSGADIKRRALTILTA